MAYDAFISYSSHDVTVANAVCHTLESRGVRCWIAPRDVLAGKDWADQIVDAIEECPAMVLVFSSWSNASENVRDELHTAVSDGKIVVTLRIEDVAPTGRMKLHLGRRHWLDAITEPMQQHLDGLADVVARLLAVPAEELPTPTGGAAQAPPGPALPEFKIPVSSRDIDAANARLLQVLHAVLNDPGDIQHWKVQLRNLVDEVFSDPRYAQELPGLVAAIQRLYTAALFLPTSENIDWQSIREGLTWLAKPPLVDAAADLQEAREYFAGLLETETDALDLRTAVEHGIRMALMGTDADRVDDHVQRYLERLRGPNVYRMDLP